jgi:hypothetical protein
MSGTCIHPFHIHSDAAKRMADAAMLAWTAGGWDSVGKFMAFSLADGSTDNVLYPRKQDAVRHNDEFRHCFICLHPAGMTACEAEIMLQFHRKAYDAGFRLADPDARSGGRDLIPRISREDIRNQVTALTKGK